MCWLQVGHYTSVNAMAKDIDLLVKNAKTYNEPGSQVFKASMRLQVRVHVVGGGWCERVRRPTGRTRTPSKGSLPKRSLRSNTASQSSPASESGEKQIVLTLKHSIKVAIQILLICSDVRYIYIFLNIWYQPVSTDTDICSHEIATLFLICVAMSRMVSSLSNGLFC